MDETDIRSDASEVTPDCELPGDEGSADAPERVMPGNAGQLRARWLEPISALNRPLFSRQLAETISALNRPLFSRQLAETISALNRPLFSRQLAETISALNRPLFSRQLAETISALNRPLFSRQLAETISALNRPLFSRQLAETISALNRPLFSRQLAETISALNRPLFSRQLAETISALNLRAATLPTLGTKEALDVRAFTALNVTRKSLTTREMPEVWPDSDVAEIEDPSLTKEKLYWLMQFDAVVKDDGLRRVCGRLFAGGHYALAVQQACIYFANMVSKTSGRADKDGADLMWTVFSPHNPVLRLNDLQTKSDKNEQQGYMEIFAGAMTGIRNPRAHEHDIEDSPEDAFALLVFYDHLMRMLNNSILTQMQLGRL